MTLVIGCGSDDDDGDPTNPLTPPGPPIGEALDGNWDANQDLTGQLLSLKDNLARIEAGLDAIQPCGTPGKNMFSDAVKGVFRPAVRGR